MIDGFASAVPDSRWPALARQQRHDGRKQRPHTAEADQAHAAQPRAIRLPGEPALDEVEIIADRREPHRLVAA